MQKLLGRGSISCAVRRQTHVFAAGATKSELVSRRPRLVLETGVTLVTPPGEPSDPSRRVFFVYPFYVVGPLSLCLVEQGAFQPTGCFPNTHILFSPLIKLSFVTKVR